MSKNNIIDFGIDQIDVRELPIDFLKEALLYYSKNITSPEILQHNEDSHFLKLKENLSIWLNNKHYSINKINSNNLLLTSGIINGLSLIISTFISNKDVILIEEPCDFTIIEYLNNKGLKVVQIPINDEGLDLDILEKKVRKYSSKQNSIFLYLMPICQNPTGITLSKKQRCNLEKIANLYENFYILANETNHFLTWNEKSLYSLSNYHPNFISLCSFNKLLAPSIKLGWIYMDLD